MKAGEIKRTCKSCRKGHKEILNKLRKENAYPDKDYSCAICDRTLEELGKYGQTRLRHGFLTIVMIQILLEVGYVINATQVWVDFLMT